MVGVTGFEPATSSTPRKRASRAAPHPDSIIRPYSGRQNGELTRIRTWDLRFRRPALYPAELLAPSLDVLLVSILAQSLLALVRSDLMPLSLPATGHLFYLLDLCPLRFPH